MTEEEIIEWQRGRQDQFRRVPESGRMVSYRNKQFVVYKNVFWPFEDSEPLVNNFHIGAGFSVLDVGTGSGVIAVFAAYRGAGRVVAIDINPQAVRTAKTNSDLHGFSEVIDVRISNVFEQIGPDEHFDVITANLPWLDKSASDLVEASHWDTHFDANRRLLSGVRSHLKPHGRIFLAQGNYGALGKIYSLAEQNSLVVRKIGEKTYSRDQSLHFYAFELTPEDRS
jgi:release factor glutamine methyltransferase